MLNTFNWIASLLGIIGAFLVAIKKPWWSCLVWIFGNGLWVLLSICNHDWPLVCMFSVYELFAVIGLITWWSKS